MRYTRRLGIEPLEDRRLLATVTTLVDGIGVPGTSLREAIADATPGETIDFSVTGTISLTSLGDLTIDKNLTISGPGANLLTIRAYDPTPTAGDGSRVFNIDDGNLTADKMVSISGLTLIGGDISGDGGAIRSLENLTVAGSTISGNAADGNGSGIYSGYGDLTVNGSTVSGNSTTYGSGGGIHSYYGSLTVTGSTISGNSTTDGNGGGIFSYSSPVTLTSSTVSGNSATYGNGGGIFSDSSTVTLTSSTISGNFAYGGGGGIYSYDGNLTVTGSTISGNRAASDGGGIYIYYGNLTVTHSTITGNQADSDNDAYGAGGGVYLYGTGAEALRHTILAGNTRGLGTRDDASGAITLQFSLIGDNTGATITIQGTGNQIGTGGAPINPLLDPLANNGGPTKTHALLAGSPAIDKGSAAAVAGAGGIPPYDQRGAPFTRVFNGDAVPGARIDIGAVERQPIPPAVFGDYNQNGVVDAADYVVWRKTLGTTGVPAYSGADGDGDTMIDQDDHRVWRAHFGQTLPSGAGSAAASGGGGSVFVPPTMPVTPTNPVQTVRVIVLNYEPTVPSMGNQTLWEIFGWNDPRVLAPGFIEDVEYASGGGVDYQIVEWRDLNEFPIFTDGFRYTADQYVQNRMTNTGWNNNSADFYTIAEQQGLAELVNGNIIDEIWMFGDHFFNLLGEAWMAGPASFFINGPSFSEFPVDRAVAGFGFSYERGVAEMLHNFGHRTENHGSRAYGGWNIANPATPWDYFTANVGQTNRTTFGVGSTHYPFNGTSDYDYANPGTVSSYADDFVLNFPNQTYAAAPMSRSAWGDLGIGDWHRAYMQWFFGHVPRGDGTAADGRQNNWYKYIIDFNGYRPTTGLARDNEAILGAAPLVESGPMAYQFTLRYYDVQGIDSATLDGSDVLVAGPNGFSQLAALVEIETQQATTAGTARTVRYQVTAPGGTWDSLDSGTYTVTLRASQVRDTAGAFLPATTLGSFQVNVSDSSRLDVAAMIAASQASVTATTWDIGGPAAIFDDSTSSLYRTPNIDPAVVTLSFVAPQTVTGFRALFSHAGGNPAYRWKVEAADSLSDLNSGAGTYQLLVPLTGTPSDVFSVATLGTSVSIQYVRLTAERLTGDNYIHINSWQLLGVVAPDGAAPMATLLAAPVAAAGDTSTSFTVRFTDDRAIDIGSVNFGDIRVTGPSGFAQTAALYGLDVNANGSPRDVTYFVAPPGGSWDHADNGTYVVELVSEQVFDTADKPVVAIALGSFVVAVPPPLPGDYNRDGAADAADYVVWRKTLGATGVPAYSGADGDGDTTIDQDDYGVWRRHFGETLPPPGAGSGAGGEQGAAEEQMRKVEGGVESDVVGSVEGGVGSAEGAESGEQAAGSVAVAAEPVAESSAPNSLPQAARIASAEPAAQHVEQGEASEEQEGDSEVQDGDNDDPDGDNGEQDGDGEEQDADSGSQSAATGTLRVNTEPLASSLALPVNGSGLRAASRRSIGARVLTESAAGVDQQGAALVAWLTSRTNERQRENVEGISFARDASISEAIDGSIDALDVVFETLAAGNAF